MKKRYIFEIEINGKYKLLINANDKDEATTCAREFYADNNYFIEKTINTLSTKVLIDTNDLIIAK